VSYYVLAVVTLGLIGAALLTLVGGLGALWIGLGEVATQAFTVSKYLVPGAALCGGALILFTRSHQ
jgi:hypothetical protein